MAKRVMIVDDDPDMVEIIKLVVEEAGYEAIGVWGSAEGLRRVKADSPDLLLLDIMMPDMDGWGLLDRMRKDPATVGIPVIAVTARTQAVDRMIGLHVAKCQDYLTKPFGNRELVEKVQGVIGKP